MADAVDNAYRVTWMMTDNQGTVRDLVNNAGIWIQHYTYDAYGQLTSGDTSLTRYLYAGREFDPTTGLEYNRERWYDPHMGRFLTQDPTGLTGGQFNFYAYVGNDPTNEIDPSGLQAIAIPVPTPAPLPIGAGAMGLAGELAPPVAGFCAGFQIGKWLGGMYHSKHGGEDGGGLEGHRKGKRESNREKHECGDTRRQRDQGGEKGDKQRQEKGQYPRKPPFGWKGPWPPR